MLRSAEEQLGEGCQVWELDFSLALALALRKMNPWIEDGGLSIAVLSHQARFSTSRSRS